MRSISWKTAALASGAVLVIGGGTAGIVLAVTGSGGQPSTTGGAVVAQAAPVKPGPLRLVSISPASGARNVDGAGTITVTYNQPPPATAPLPRLSPAIAGSWQRDGNAVVFTPAAGYPASTHVTVTVTKAGAAGSGTPESATFTTGNYSTLRLQQILAQLGYLPMTWTPSAGGYGGASMRETTGGAPAAGPVSQLAAAYSPPAGSFQWQPGYPAQLRSFWAQGKANTLDRGAITGFEADHGLTIDGVASATVWKALLAAAAQGEQNTHGYSYAIASQRLPETLTIWHDGQKVFSSPANTGISIDPTPVGTFPVYLRMPFQVMQGTNPDGSHYADPVQWVSYFSGGSAVHYIGRGSYGSPQSLGCVELPYDAAKEAYPYLSYGTLVTVTP